jgi:putative ABC transport system permease protein
MFKNVLKVALRNLMKNKVYAFVNICGLTIGMTSCILIGLYISQELSYDRFHENSNRIARITMEYGGGGNSTQTALTGTKTGPQFKRSFPSVESFCRTYKRSNVVSYGDKTFKEHSFFYADSSFLKIFSFHLIQGDPSTALDAPGKVVLTEHIARKYFGSENAIGKTLRIENQKDYQVTGVMADVPGNSQMQFDFVGSFTSLGVSKSEEWFSANYITYLLLQNPGDYTGLQRQISYYMKNQVAKELNMRGKDYLTYHLEPLKQVHLYSSLQGLEPNGNIIYIYILGAIAILILITACINYTNLSTAQSARRGAEIGMRKVFGAQKWQLFNQFIAESAVITFVTILLAVVISIQLLPVFNNLTGKSLKAFVLFKPLSLLAMLLLGTIVSVLAGAYPAFVLSSARLINILKSGFRFSSSGRGLRKALIVFQFVISAFLVTSTIIILQQLSFIQKKNLGYDKDHVVVLPLDRQSFLNYDAIKKNIESIPGVSSVTGAYESPVFVGWGDNIKVNNGGVKKELMVNAMPVDLDFIKTMGIQIIAGSDYTLADLQKLDTSNNMANLHYSFILNETAVKELGWKPEEAIGKTISKNVTGVIKAVVKDFHIASLHTPIKPLVIFLENRMVNDMFVKISGNNISSTLAGIEGVWKDRVPGHFFEFHFLDDDYDHLYESEKRTAQIFGLFSSVAILLACMGLFALAAYSTIQRTKEIGIRKVLGASLAGITVLVSKEFIKLVFIAILIASPIAWYASGKWLQDFAYRINMHWWVFILAGALSVLIALRVAASAKQGTTMLNKIKCL